jgi:hypothetical protein
VAIRTAFARGRVARSEEGAAAGSVVLLVSVVVGGMLTLFESIHAVPLLVALGTLGLAATLIVRLERAQPWAAAVLWATILLRTEGMALIPSLMMIALCVVLGLGPDRILDWLRDDWAGPPAHDAGDGWIEDA